MRSTTSRLATVSSVTVLLVGALAAAATAETRINVEWRSCTEARVVTSADITSVTLRFDDGRAQEFTTGSAAHPDRHHREGGGHDEHGRGNGNGHDPEHEGNGHAKAKGTGHQDGHSNGTAHASDETATTEVHGTDATFSGTDEFAGAQIREISVTAGDTTGDVHVNPRTDCTTATTSGTRQASSASGDTTAGAEATEAETSEPTEGAHAASRGTGHEPGHNDGRGHVDGHSNGAGHGEGTSEPVDEGDLHTAIPSHDGSFSVDQISTLHTATPTHDGGFDTTEPSGDGFSQLGGTTPAAAAAQPRAIDTTLALLALWGLTAAAVALRRHRS